jgi:hypothetical protein
MVKGERLGVTSHPAAFVILLCISLRGAAFLKELGARRIVNLWPTGQPNPELAILPDLAVYADAAAMLLRVYVVAH